MPFVNIVEAPYLRSRQGEHTTRLRLAKATCVDGELTNKNRGISDVGLGSDGPLAADVIKTHNVMLSVLLGLNFVSG